VSEVKPTCLGFKSFITNFNYVVDLNWSQTGHTGPPVLLQVAYFLQLVWGGRGSQGPSGPTLSQGVGSLPQLQEGCEQNCRSSSRSLTAQAPCQVHPPPPALTLHLITGKLVQVRSILGQRFLVPSLFNHLPSVGKAGHFIKS